MLCSKSICVFGILLFVCASISTVEANINCYQCNSHNDPDCTDLSAHKPHIVAGYYQPCDKDEEGNEPFCRTIQYKFKFIKDDEVASTRVIRTCGFRQSQKECYKADNDHHLEEVCQCFTDGCNSAPNLSILSSITISIIAFCLYFIN